jgi:hypothetical protein
MVKDTSPKEPAASIIITLSRRNELTECKHGKDTYDKVIGRLIAFYRKVTGSTIVE